MRHVCPHGAAPEDVAFEAFESVLRDKPADMRVLSPKGTVSLLRLSGGQVLEQSLRVSPPLGGAQPYAGNNGLFPFVRHSVSKESARFERLPLPALRAWPHGSRTARI